MHAKLTTGAMLLAMSTLLLPAAAAPDWQMVAKTFGKSGTETPDGVYRIGLPRTDLKVSLDGVALKPGFALGGWIAFEPMGNQAMVMGDIVLTQDEVNPVMKKLEESGIEITALHNHLLRAEPMTLYMHVFGQGDPVTLATALHAGLALSKTPMENAAKPQASAQQIELDTAAVDQAIGHKGKANGGVYQFSIPRAETITDSGMQVPASMGSAIAINFQPTGAGKAAITGDFVLIASEVNPDEQPRLFFMHFWANDDAVKLGRGLKAALDKMDLKNS
ncbi:MAG: DUF1259 domain-containing protein [Mesorhizobium sp.]|nr:MAG: DUF1259 domain-containing protein [Mesorhizobium sp.]TJW48083.1 MAG: DUF1259 domain-containing protein [Mesorhizobium sp.]